MDDCFWHRIIMPHTFFNTKTKKPWCNSACSRAVNDREAAHKRNRTHPSAEIHALYIYARNHAKFILQITKNSLINRKCQNLSNFNSSRDFWHLTNNISKNFLSPLPPLLQLDGSTAVSSFFKAEILAQTFATNSSLDDTGHIPLTPPLSDYFIPYI